MNMQARTEMDAAEISAGMDELAKGIEKASKELEQQQEQQAPRKRPLQSEQPEQSELERFMASIGRQREDLRKRTLARESRFQLNRAAVVNDFWVRFQQLQHELDETIRRMDLAHDQQMSADRKLFDALDAARG